MKHKQDELNFKLLRELATAPLPWVNESEDDLVIWGCDWRGLGAEYDTGADNGWFCRLYIGPLDKATGLVPELEFITCRWRHGVDLDPDGAVARLHCERIMRAVAIQSTLRS